MQLNLDKLGSEMKGWEWHDICHIKGWSWSIYDGEDDHDNESANFVSQLSCCDDDDDDDCQDDSEDDDVVEDDDESAISVIQLNCL